MESGSILYRTLGLFAASFGAAVIVLVAAIWMADKVKSPGGGGGGH